MKFSKLRPRRYQLKKTATAVADQGHPWIFRSHLSTAAEVFEDGQWLRLVDGANHVLGYGIYEKEGIVGIRVLKLGEQEPTAKWLEDEVREAILRRGEALRACSAWRAINGENDGLPGITFDVYGDTGVLQTYSPVLDGMGRFCAGVLRRRLGLSSVLWKFPSKRRGKRPDRMLFGPPVAEVAVQEGALRWRADLASGQKSGAFLDLRCLRRWILGQDWRGLRVLDLFSYTGVLGLAAEIAGAREVLHVDDSASALEFGKQHHTRIASRHQWIKADIFRWFPELPREEVFDAIIVDPPQMASSTTALERALIAYRRLYKEAARRLAPRGVLIACCCTSRIQRARLRSLLVEWLAPRLSLEGELTTEPDHPVGFPEGDYLKIFVFRADGPGNDGEDKDETRSQGSPRLA